MESVFTYLDYRLYLSDFYRAEKQENSNFSYRQFSQRAKVKAPNFLMLLIDGKRNLASDTIPRVIKALHLEENEGTYFRDLVLFNQSKTLAEKERLFHVLMEQRKPYVPAKLLEAQFAHYEHWYSVAIRELINFIPLAYEDRFAYRRLGRLLVPQIGETQVRQAIKQLLSLELIYKDEEEMLHQKEAVISTGDEVRSLFVKKFHESMITLGIGAMDNFESSERDISGITMAVSQQSFELIKQELQQTRKRIMEIAELDNNPDRAMQLNMQVFPLMRPYEK